ncbi:hypothetical protein SAMN05421507_103461 [Lentzea jiangxiensis]|uniref:Uncharacterized protein n=1 Tax=Lentzea jiangxiensis TaxID=641025 RepID=A0A1H0LVF9_9PSEU|nr:hypothetical protein SAMN05421507_103461 [Lentzea jiangxiensis]
MASTEKATRIRIRIRESDEPMQWCAPKPKERCVAFSRTSNYDVQLSGRDAVK